MKRKYLAVTAFVAALLVVASGVAYAAHRFGGGMMKGHIVGFLEDSLQKNPLTPQQKSAIEATLDKTIADVKSHKADRQAAMDEIHRRDANARRETTDLADPNTGETWNVWGNHNYWWRLPGSDQIIGTDDPNPSAQGYYSVIQY